jgi:hypothetical protein
MGKNRVFISFDYDNDSTLKEFLVGQSKLSDSPFEMADWSIKEHINDDWKAKAKARIRKVDCVIVICGRKTHAATGVNAEVKIAQELQVPYFLLNGYKGVACTRPLCAPAEKIYDWTWPNLKMLIGGAR